MIRCILFDLDGTLVDTAPDLGYALNALLREERKPPLLAAQIRPVASAGARGLLRIGFGLQPTDADYEPMRRRFLDIYSDNLTRESRLFEGMTAVLEAARQRGVAWGIVTNKPARFTDPLVGHLAFANPPVCVISGDTAAYPKPHPAPMLMACEQAGIESAHCVYVGDAQRDIESGKRAGMRTVAALYGYIEAGDDPHLWGADAFIHTPGGLWPCLDNDMARPPQK